MMRQDPSSAAVSGQLTVADLSTLCAQTIRVQLNWRLLESLGGTVKAAVLSELEEFDGLVLPWYIRAAGNGETTWRDPEGRALRADDLPACLSELRPERQQAVLDLARAFERSQQPVLMILPTYRLGSGCRLLLDGNHRVAALRMGPVPFRALLAEIEGPMDRRVIPDLVRHGG